MRLLECGERAVLIEVGSIEEVMGLYRTLSTNPPAGLIDLVPAARTVLVTFDPSVTDLNTMSADLHGREVFKLERRDGPLIEIPVVYQGEDLAEVAQLTGLSESEVIARHSAAEYRVAFCGFAPGFGYLTGLDAVLQLPRRDTPRPRVPAGSVAIAAEFTGVYPRESPGGWHLLGRTERILWNVDDRPPALLSPGTRVRFVASS